MSASTSLAGKVEQDPKITVIYDNRCADRSIKSGFGFSCLVEWRNQKILFDTGGDKGAFFLNIDKLKIKLEEITNVVFSHHHWDHTAGMNEVLKGVNKEASVFIPKVFSSKLENLVPKELRLERVAQFRQIDTDICAFVLKGGYWCTSIYEQFLVLDTARGLLILTGCAHPGIISIIQKARSHFMNKEVDLVMGGFHLHRSFACTSAKVVRQFEELRVKRVAPCHCAGEKAIQQFRDAFHENFIAVGTGTVVGGSKDEKKE